MSKYPASHPAIVCTRRDLLEIAGIGSLAAGISLASFRTAAAQTPVSGTFLEDLVIDLSGAPESIDPALAYAARDWSIVHSIYDSPVGFNAEGDIVPLAAASFTAIDDLTYEIVLREGLIFHDGSAVTSAAVTRSVTYMQESGSSASSLFTGITSVEEKDDLTARIISAEPSPWLPAQLAVWLLLIPEGYTTDQALSAPVGSGPYRFDSMDSGNSIVLARNSDYTWNSPKGRPLAERVEFRFVPESSTRIADLTTGAAQIVNEIPFGQLPAVSDGGAIAIDAPVVGSQWIRIATDVAPFDIPEIRQALNYAVDVQSIAGALVSTEAHPLASLFPDERSIAFNPDLVPYAHDVEKARQLLADAGVGEISTELEITSGARVDIAEAIAAQLGEVGIAVTIKVSEYTDFNANWASPDAPPLRLVTWSPLYDPHTLLSLVYASDGYLSRYANDDVDQLIEDAAVETDADHRAELYRELSSVMYDDAPAIYLWNLTVGYGVAEEAAAWQPRGDEYVLPLEVE